MGRIPYSTFDVGRSMFIEFYFKGHVLAFGCYSASITMLLVVLEEKINATAFEHGFFTHHRAAE
jgi:hypothetical protein